MLKVLMSCVSALALFGTLSLQASENEERTVQEVSEMSQSETADEATSCQESSLTADACSSCESSSEDE